MLTRRRFTRYSCNLKGSFRCRGLTTPCQLENISVGGALISMKGALEEPVRRGHRCVLTILEPLGKPPLHITARVAHHAFTLIGLQFQDNNPDAEELLKTIDKQNDLTFSGDLSYD